MAGPTSSTCPRCGTNYGFESTAEISNPFIVGLGTERTTEYRVVECRCGYLLFVGLDLGSVAAPDPVRQALPFASRF